MITSYEQALLDSRTELLMVQDRLKVLQSGIKSLEALVGTGSMAPNARSGMKLPERVLKAMDGQPSRRWSVTELEDVLNKDGLGGAVSRASLVSSLKRMVEDGRLTSGTDNHYALPPTA